MKETPIRLQAVHAALLFLALIVVAAALPTLGWPWLMAAPLAIYAAVVTLVPPLRRTLPRFAVGRMTGAPLFVAFALASFTVAALAGFHFWMRPDVSSLAANMPREMLGSILLAWVVLSVVNATLEEIIFRGVFYEGILEEWGPVVAIVVTSVLFGLGHYNGYPPGPMGAFLAGGWGGVLGVIRWWTGGLGLITLCHIAADATIFYLVTQSRSAADI